MVGSATAKEPNGTCISCVLDLTFELEPRGSAGGVLEYEGVHGGSLGRTILDANGNGIALWPEVYGAVVARSIAPDQVQILIPINATADSRFWRELSDLEGVFDSDTTVTGTWMCAPFDISSGGYVDTMYTATGTWTLSPLR